MSFLDIKNLSFSYGENSLFNNFSLAVAHGEIHSILGPSGSGKSTLLHLIAGFLPPASGEIELNAKTISDKAPEQRQVGIVFQDHCLFPHMTAAQNVGFGVKNDNRNEVIQQYLQLVRLADRANSMPAELSGGECQRIALARSLAAQPQVLLFDEAFSSLDEELRHELRSEVKELLKKIKLTSIVVTHSREEAEFFSDKITEL